MASRKHWDPTERPAEITEFLTAAENLQESMKDLLSAWEALELDDKLRFQTTNIISKEYPFKLSFDEQYLGVIDWVHDLREHL